MKTNKCNFCKDGTKRFTTEKRINNTIIETVKNCTCKECNGNGVVAIDNLSYFIELNELNFKIRLYKSWLKDISNNIVAYEYVATKRCPICNGKGRYLLETKVNENEKVNIYKICSHCNGDGEIIDEEKMINNIKDSIENFTERKTELLNIANKDNNKLVNKYLNRDIKQYIEDTNYNVCLQCSHYTKDYTCSLKCIHKDIKVKTSYFSAVSKSSKTWYDKNINQILELIRK